MTTDTRTQGRRTTAFLLREALIPLAWAAGAALVLGLGFWLLAVMNAWEYRTLDASGAVLVEVEASGAGVVVSSPLEPVPAVLAGVLVGLAATTVVMGFALPGRHAGVLLASGVTRRSLTTGLILAVAAMVGVVAVSLLLVVLVAGTGWLGSSPGWAAVAGLALLAAATLAGAALTLLFLRFTWWACVLFAALVAVAGPVLVLWAPGIPALAAVGAAATVALVGVVLALAAGAATALLLRRMPVA